MCQPPGHPRVKRIRVFPTADAYPITCQSYLSRPAEPGGPSPSRSQATREKQPSVFPRAGWRTALLFPVPGEQNTAHATSQARQQRATCCSHSLKTKPIFSPQDSCPSCRSTDPGRPASTEQKPGLHDTTSKGKHDVVVEAAALRLPVHIPAQQPEAGEGL